MRAGEQVLDCVICEVNADISAAWVLSGRDAVNVDDWDFKAASKSLLVLATNSLCAVFLIPLRPGGISPSRVSSALSAAVPMSSCMSSFGRRHEFQAGIALP